MNNAEDDVEMPVADRLHVELVDDRVEVPVDACLGGDRARLEGLVEAHPNVSTEWITLIIIPVISNAAEHTTAVIVACKGKFDLAMSVAIGSCIQIALFVIPVLVLVAWGMGKPLTLLFDPLETLVLFFSVILVKFSVEDGKAHWMSGVVLVGEYVPTEWTICVLTSP